MAETEIVKIEVTYQDPFSLKALYTMVYWWLKENGYLEDSVTSEQDVEVMYLENKYVAGNKDYRIWWRCEKNPPESFFKYKLSVDYQGINIKDTEIVKDDKKYKMQIGEITIKLRGVLVTEHGTGSFDDNWFTKHIKKPFLQRWYYEKIEFHEDIVYEEVYKLQSAIKEFLELRQIGRQPDMFFNKKGF